MGGSNPPTPHYHLFIHSPDNLFFYLFIYLFIYLFVVFWWLIRSSFQASWKKKLELWNQPLCEKNNNRGFRPGLTQTRLYSHRSRIEA